MHIARVRRNDNEEYAEHAKDDKEYAEFKEHIMPPLVLILRFDVQLEVSRARASRHQTREVLEAEV
jgi:hypothetical protein